MLSSALRIQLSAAKKAVTSTGLRAFCSKPATPAGSADPASSGANKNVKPSLSSIEERADEIIRHVHSRNHVFIHSVAGAPRVLIEALGRRAPCVRDVNVYQIHTEGPAPYVDPALKDSFRCNNYFIGKNTRKAVEQNNADYTPIFLSEIPLLFRRGLVPLDVALITVSPPDKHGFCSLGTSVDVSRAAVDTAKCVLAVINPNMPRTFGDSLIHINKIDEWMEVDEPLPELILKDPSPVERAIGQKISELVDDGATLQMGIGAIPDATLRCLTHHKHLGIHTEMFSDGVIDLVEKGIVDNSKKKVHPGRLVSGFLAGSKKLYDFVHDNPLIAMRDIAFTNDTSVIRKNPKVTAINSCIEIDLTGQVSADSIGTRFFSGVGGQIDFIRGAALVEDGKAIIALPSSTRKGETRIVPTLKEGAGVVTTRAHVHWVVTEYGAVNLFGKSVRERAALLTSIAHPDHQQELERQARERFGFL
eukprot:CAMPEP_0113905974 /NCGR_PEP_ID=MMETSP0780_2-20120614/24417_1 /TAXON_ID=652834 /ORGANISM="Palpitomonas bilix" /LENGTH=475 /DNA_ID=CAMNT_0000900377 /DNA_START=89 /DNA_END=1516 /DNA_ORIENTATION=+ /assembly_acc=CAM_ASM_000599